MSYKGNTLMDIIIERVLNTAVQNMIVFWNILANTERLGS